MVNYNSTWGFVLLLLLFLPISVSAQTDNADPFNKGKIKSPEELLKGNFTEEEFRITCGCSEDQKPAIYLDSIEVNLKSITSTLNP